MGILFWNLAINLAYFSLVSKAALELGSGPGGETVSALATLCALLAIIVGGEFLPKSLAVTKPLMFVRAAVVPLTVAIRAVDIFLPIVRLANEISRRLIWPGFRSESYLELADLHRAIELSSDDAQLVDHERQLLKNVIRLSEIRVEEWMRPRTQYLSFQPPVSIDQLGGKQTPSGYMLITDADGHEVVDYVDLSTVADSVVDIEQYRIPVEIVPWCATIADAINRLQEDGRRVAAIVNEFGETVGILTWEEIFEALLQFDNAQSIRELAKAEIRPQANGEWLATGMTKLRRLERVIHCRIGSGRSLTIAGVLQEHLHRLPEKGDRCRLDGIQLDVVEAGVRGEMLVRITLVADEQAKESS